MSDHLRVSDWHEKTRIDFLLLFVRFVRFVVKPRHPQTTRTLGWEISAVQSNFNSEFLIKLVSGEMVRTALCLTLMKSAQHSKLAERRTCFVRMHE